MSSHSLIMPAQLSSVTISLNFGLSQYIHLRFVHASSYCSVGIMPMNMQFVKPLLPTYAISAKMM